MKLFLFVAFLASAPCAISAKKLLVVGGLNGGLVGLNPGVVGLNPGVVGLNPGVVGLNPGVVGLNPGVVGLNPGVVGLNPGVVGVNPGVFGLNGGLLPPGLVVGGMNPALIGGAPIIPPYMYQPQLGMPNAPAQFPQQFPFQPNGGLLPPVNRQFVPPQQQAAGQMNPGANGQQPQGDMPAGPARRFRRALQGRMQDNSVAQVPSSPTTTEQPDE